MEDREHRHTMGHRLLDANDWNGGGVGANSNKLKRYQPAHWVGGHVVMDDWFPDRWQSESELVYKANTTTSQIVYMIANDRLISTMVVDEAIERMMNT